MHAECKWDCLFKKENSRKSNILDIIGSMRKFVQDEEVDMRAKLGEFLSMRKKWKFSKS